MKLEKDYNKLFHEATTEICRLKKALVISEDKLLECAENNYNEGFIEGCKKLKESK